MASRYLAKYCRSPQPGRKRTRSIAELTGLQQIFTSETLNVYADTADAHVGLAGRSGLLFGTVFDRDMPRNPAKLFNVEQTQTILTSQGSALNHLVWGGFVAFICDESSNQFYVLRDPSGMMPCYFVQTPNAIWFSSDLESLFAAGLPIPDIDWANLAHHIRFSDLPSRRTALLGVEELMAGFKLSASGVALTAEPYWSPWDHIAQPTPNQSNGIADQLRDTVMGCIRSWGGTFEHVLLGVSGGLDSSIIATCLAGNHKAVTCFTLATQEAEGDERQYAGALTDALGLPLLVGFHDLNNVDITRATNPHLPRPGAPAFGQSGITTMLDAAERSDMDAFFTGVGGDNVFCFSQSATPLLDRYLAEGLGQGVWETLNDICRLTDCSYWEAIGGAWKKAQQSRAQVQWRGFEWPWLMPAAQTAADKTIPPHPWLNVPRSALPGKIVHVTGLIRIQGTLDSFSRDGIPPQIHPLLSQPIVELCLQIPSWEWVVKGRNRSVARQAFDSHLPDLINRRRSKGGPTHFACAVVEANLRRLYDHLIGGLLDQHGILDATALAPLLDGKLKLRATDHIRISILAETEAWARYWTAKRATQFISKGGPTQLTQDGAIL